MKQEMMFKVWCMCIVVLAIALATSARWLIVGAPGGGGVQLQNSTTLSITSAALTPDPQDPNRLVITVRLQMR